MKNIFFYLFIFLKYISFILCHQCGYQEYHNLFKDKLKFVRTSTKKQNHFGQNTRQRIRIHADFSSYLSLLTPEQINKFQKEIDHVKKDLVPISINYLEERIKVDTLDTIICPINEQKCGNAIIPQEHKIFGVKADLLIYIVANVSFESTYVAFAGPCFSCITANGRPTVGFIQYNLPLNEPKQENFQDNVKGSIHELTHALGFAPILYPTFRDEYGIPRGESGVVKKVFLRGKERILIITPEVVKIARKYFQCPQLEGLELEDEGGSKSILAHWEKSILNNELMTATIERDSVFSVFTMALLKDTGWYSVNYQLTSPLFFGKNKGCQFISHLCHSQHKFEEFCYDSDKNQICDQLHESPGQCSRQAFTENENCLYKIPSYHADCKTNRYKEDDVESFAFSEQQGPRSKCLVNNIIRSEYKLQNDFRPGCYQADCEDGTINIYVQGLKYKCRYPGEIIELNTSQNFKGQLQCPNYDEFCSDIYPQCPNSCSGKGFCQNSQCMCQPGYIGIDCSIMSGCQNNCNGRGDCLPNGQCRCFQGWTGYDCQLQVDQKKSQNRHQCPNDCSKRGQCDSGQCICFQGWEGLDCTKKSCPWQCHNGGQCVDGQCHCLPKWFGEDCSIKISKNGEKSQNQKDQSNQHILKCPNKCNGNGKCKNDNCICDSGWQGIDCSISMKNKKCPNDCSGHGLCYSETGTCTCEKGYTGKACDQLASKIHLKQKLFKGKIWK